MTPERETEYFKLQSDQIVANAAPSVSTSASEFGDDSVSLRSLTFTEKLRRHRCPILIFAAAASIVVFVLLVIRSGILFPSNDIDLNTIASLPADGQANSVARLQSRIQSMCAITSYPDRCVKTLTAIAGPPDSPTAAHFPLIAASVQAAAVAVQIAANYSAGLDLPRLPPQHRDCRDLLLLADAQLRAAHAGVNAAARNVIGDRTVPDIVDALSAALAFEVTCSDGLSQTATLTPAADAITNNMTKAVKNAMEDTLVSFSIVYSVTSSTFGLPSEKRKDNAHGAMAQFVPSAEGSKPDAVVAKDGSGDFRTISEALGRAAAKGRSGRFVIYVKAGVYDEAVQVTAGMAQVTMYGDGPAKTIVTGNRRFGNGTSFYGSATFAVTGNGFMARGMRFENRAEAEMAVALRVESDLAVFYDCHVAGYHSVLYAHAHRQFYRDCEISGAADVITGGAAAMLQNCRVVLRPAAARRTGVATANLRVDWLQNAATVLQNCTVVGEKGLPAAFLGRIAKDYSTVVVMESMLGEVIAEKGWETKFWPENVRAEMEAKSCLAEYNNRGPGKGSEEERKGGRVMPAKEVAMYTAGEFISGNSWLKGAGIPFYAGFAADAS